MALKRDAKIKRQQEGKIEKNRKRLAASGGGKKGSVVADGGKEEKLDNKGLEGNGDGRTKKEVMEDDKRKALRKSNKEGIKAKNFLKSS